MQKTESYEKITVIRVEFPEEDFNLLLERVGDYQPGAEAKFIYDTVMARLRRKPRGKEKVKP